MKKPNGDFYVLWALPQGEDVPFEVSREVATPLLPRCEHSPYCPGERTLRLVGERDPARSNRSTSKIHYDMDPDFVFDGSACPYEFGSKDDCFRAINRKALREGCVPGDQLSRVANFLKALGYQVSGEKVPETDLEGDRILLAHGPIFHFHELRVENGPAGMVLYLIRNPREDERPESCEDL
jgi:hypothetical protein